MSRLKARECPFCHQEVSFKECSSYFLYGTDHTIRCNHCNRKLALTREPIPFNLCVNAGFVMGVIPAVYFLFIQKLGFVRSMTYTVMLCLLMIVIVSILTYRRIYFKGAD